jgi:predicted ester cyclase
VTDEGPIRGPVEFKEKQYVPFVSAFPDLRVVVEATLAQGDEVVARWCATGTHLGDGLGFPPTGQPVTFRGMSWIRVRDGTFVEGWQSSNIADVIRGLAANPSA